jgi:hypothetical protein
MTVVSIVAPERPLTLDVSLRGFTAAFDALEMPEAPATPPAPAADPLQSDAPLAPRQ